MSGDNNRFEAIFGSSGGSGGGGGGLSSVNIQNTLYVAKNGNDTTGTRNDLAKPYLTIAGATADASLGDCIYVFRGSYTETSADTFGSGFFYYLEPNVTVVNDTTALIQDSSTAKTITIFGYGDITCLLQPCISLTNPSSNLRLQCNNISSGNQVMVFSGNKLELDCQDISCNLSGLTYTGSSDDSYINFNNCVMSSTSTLTWRISHASGTLRIRGKYYEQDFARVGGDPFTTVMTSDARLTIKIDEFNVKSGGFSGNFDTTGNGVAVYNMLKKGGSAFDFGTDAGVQVDFYNCQMTTTSDILQLNIFNGIVNCFNCYFLIISSRFVDMQGAGTLQLVDCIINQENDNSIIQMTQTGGVGTEITPKLILQNVLLYNEAGGLGFSIDGTIVGTDKIPINVQGNVTATNPIDTTEIDNVITGNPIVNDIDIKVTNTYLTNF